MLVKDILKKTNIITISPEDTLSAALHQLGSSHDAAFIFDRKKFLGVINPYYAVIKKSYPAHTKVTTSLMHPPKLQMSDSIEKAIRLMQESKIHYLPVFQGDTFKGIVSARRILKHIVASEKLRIPVSEALRQHNLHLIRDTEFLFKALSEFKNKRVSKLVVIDAKGKLTGVLAYYDILDYVAEPRKRLGFGRKGQRDPILQKQVKKFQRTHVLTVPLNATLADATSMILDHAIGSVVVLDHQKPIGIITTKSIFSQYLYKPRKLIIQFNIRGLSTASAAVADNFYTVFQRLLAKVPNVDKAEVVIQEKKQGGLYKAGIKVAQKGEKSVVVSSESHNLQLMLFNLIKKVKRLLRKD
ncbi:hypothetical protein A3I56_03520 [Candidatus Roizmanbacteria bacterium RIFCSPLOWO2_02_FULL_43_10]|uniref:CBS domain-containing protein n=3 Tax=Candidatus Roizmaniibacteriota TaxID=1752723 RepID=A0A1F7JT75_9BACT|nr:MAG: hypothetical protein A3D08_03550 [Candidatus Roizmanbacteria bacterium RIFCSPHIGHO2_02_FULL_43_11]OGK38267.1 MAG: hypothetical protein A3F32_02605 [Candidatus Roizmanbacteria bacterium RIFCSPHIGHO2_12_FULL_42_10]OGK58804.1 MAG: hypothetical protein A3I56_03520 [Candidatus Roizmanbacteria bacterium RIFCSPLOWO2_02_FULL_43_10]